MAKCPIMFVVVENEYNGRYLKAVELDGVPQVGHRFAVENEKGRAIFRVDEVVWEEGMLPRVMVSYSGVAETSFGGQVLEAGGWSSSNG